MRALVVTTMSERDAVALGRDTLQIQNDRLRDLLLQLRRMQLGFEAIEQAIAKADAEAEKLVPELRKDNAAKRRASRGALRTHLQRIAVTRALEDTACPGCRATMTVISDSTLTSRHPSTCQRPCPPQHHHKI
jgi:transposase